MNRLKNLKSQLGSLRTSSSNNNINKDKDKNDKINSNSNSPSSIYIKEVTSPFNFEFKTFLFSLLSHTDYIKPELFESYEEEQDFVYKAFSNITRDLNNTKIYTIIHIRNDLILFLVFCDVIHAYHTSVYIKFISQLSWYYNSIKTIGTDKHKVYLERALELKDLGSFGLSEFNHGSNYFNIQTTAIYSKLKKTFTLYSNNKENYKWFITNAGKGANMCVVYAKTIIEDINYGINAFLVQLRDFPYGNCISENIEIGGLGKTIENNGLDTGFIGFNGLEIDYDMMLDKYCQIDHDGNFISEYKDSYFRFTNMMGYLEEGRLIMLLTSSQLLWKAFLITSKYTLERRQYKVDDEKFESYNKNKKNCKENNNNKDENNLNSNINNVQQNNYTISSYGNTAADSKKELYIVPEISNFEIKETKILRYQLVHQRVITALSELVAFRALAFLSYFKYINLYNNNSNDSLINKSNANNTDFSKIDMSSIPVIDVHALISCSKPLITSKVQLRLQELREVLGGNGYSIFSNIGEYKGINDLNCTWEGDNNVLYQHTGRYIVSMYLNYLKAVNTINNLNPNSNEYYDKLNSNSSVNNSVINDYNAKTITRSDNDGDISKRIKEIEELMENNYTKTFGDTIKNNLKGCIKSFITNNFNFIETTKLKGSENNHLLQALNNKDKHAIDFHYYYYSKDVLLIYEILKYRFLNYMKTISDEINLQVLLENQELWNNAQSFNIKNMVYSYAELKAFESLLNRILYLEEQKVKNNKGNLNNTNNSISHNDKNNNTNNIKEDYSTVCTDFLCLKVLLYIYGSNLILSENCVSWTKDLFSDTESMLGGFLNSGNNNNKNDAVLCSQNLNYKSNEHLLYIFNKILREKNLEGLKIVSKHYIDDLLIDLALPDNIMNNRIWSNGISGILSICYDQVK